MKQRFNRTDIGGDKLPMHHHRHKIISTLNRFEHRPERIVKPTGMGLIKVQLKLLDFFGLVFELDMFCPIYVDAVMKTHARKL